VLELVVQRVLRQVLVLRRELQVQQTLLALQQEPELQLVPLFERELQMQKVSLQLLNSELLQIVQTSELGEFHPLVRQLQVSLLMSPLVSLLVNMS
jgi:hypothetical protein